MSFKVPQSLAYWPEVQWDHEIPLGGSGVIPEVEESYESELEKFPFAVKLWLLYLQNKRAATPHTRFAIFERAVKVLPRSYKLWHGYLTELVTEITNSPNPGREFPVGNNAFERCLTHLSSMPRLWMLYLDFLKFQKVLTRSRRVFDRALQALPITQHKKIWDNYLPWISGVGCPRTAITLYKRYLMLEPSKINHFIDLLKRFERWGEAASLLADLLGGESSFSVEGKSSLELWQDLCEIISKHPHEVSSSLDIESLLRSGVKRFTENGKLWCSLAQHFILLGHLEKARDVYEESLEKVSTVSDFGIIFDSYSKFLETLIRRLVQEGGSGVPSEIDLYLARLEELLKRRPLLLSSVKLRQNPHDVAEWLRRAALFESEPNEMIKVFAEAVATIDPVKSVGRVSLLWVKFAHFYEAHGDLGGARDLFARAVKARLRSADELATVWCAWAEMELLHGEFARALEVSRRSVQRGAPDPPTEEERVYYHQRGAARSVRLWSLCVDLEESFGTPATLQACFAKMFDSKIVTPAQVLNYTALLQERKRWEEAFKIYEMGVAIFRWPQVHDVWLAYLTAFVARYGGRKLERARELFEQALSPAPPHLSKNIFLLYGKLEEEFGLAGKAIDVYDRAVRAAPDPEDALKFTLLTIARVAELLGITRTRRIYESGIERLVDMGGEEGLGVECAVKLALKFAQMERSLGETDRARAIFQHAAQFCDPQQKPEFWQRWREFEIAHGNEETFRNMLRNKRAVVAAMADAQNDLKEITKKTTPDPMTALAESALQRPVERAAISS